MVNLSEKAFFSERNKKCGGLRAANFSVLADAMLTFYTPKYTICTNFQAIIMIITKNRDLPAKKRFLTSKKVV